MKQCQRQIGPIYKQFTQPSHHAEIVEDLLESPFSALHEKQSNTGMLYYEPLSPDIIMSDKSDPHALNLARMRAQYNVIRKRKRFQNFSDDELRGVGEEVELDPALFIQKEESKSASPREYRSIRQRKKVKFAGKRKEQEFHEYMPTHNIVGAALSRHAEETKDPHLPRSRPYVPDGEEIPDFIYSDDSEDLMDSVRSVIHETKTPSTDPIEVDEGYEDSESENSDACDDSDSDISVQNMEGISPSKIQRLEGISPPDNLDEIGEPGPTIKSDVGNLKIEDVLNNLTSGWTVECPACGKSVNRNKMTDHLDTGCQGYFTAIDSNDDTIHEYSDLQTFNQTVACPVCQKFVILERINEHLDARCSNFLAEDILPKSNIGGPSLSLKSTTKSPKSILKGVSKDFHRSLKTGDAESKGPHVSFAGEPAVKLLSPHPLTSLPRWMREDPPLKPLTKIVETRDNTETNTEVNKQSTNFKGNIVPIGHSANAEEQDEAKGSRKGKEVLYPSLPDEVEEEPFKAHSGSVQTEDKKAIIAVAGAGEDAGDEADADDEKERGRSKLRGGHANRKRSTVRSRSHGKRRRERSLTNHC